MCELESLVVGKIETVATNCGSDWKNANLRVGFSYTSEDAWQQL